jgi:4-hydroxy-4-methyl-2-oxoglutarate aldolase
MPVADKTPWSEQPDSPDIIDRYRQVSSCQVSDSMGALGLSRAGLRGVQPIDDSTRVVGPAFTVTCVPADEAPAGRVEYLQDIIAGSVVVIANGGRTDCSVWGGQRTVAARQRGAVGTVVDGACRDVSEHLELGYPVFALARTVVGSAGIASPVASQQPIVAGGVTVNPGDLVIGDASGVVVVPGSHVRQVLEHTEAEAREERRIAAEVAAGRDYFAAKRGASNAARA